MPSERAMEMVLAAGIGRGGETDLAAAMEQASGIHIPVLARRVTPGHVTNDQFGEVVRMVLGGTKAPKAANAAGVPTNVWRKTMRRGEKDAEEGRESNEASIWRTVKKAEILYQQLLRSMLFSHAEDQWRVPLALLEESKTEQRQDAEVEDKDRDARARRLARLRDAVPVHAEDKAALQKAAVGEDVIDAQDDQ